MVTFNDSQRTRVTHHIAPAGGAQVQIVGGLPVFPAAAPAAAPAAFVPTTQKIRGQIAAAEKRCADLADELERYEATLDRLRYEHADAQAAEALEIAQADTWRTEREDQARELAELRAQVEAGRDDAADQEIAALRAELAEQRARNKIERTERTEPPPAPEGLDDDDS
jgi:DNA repair exonuclease SbcCD ATPase subunit